MSERTCATCKHESLETFEGPCGGCYFRDEKPHWEQSELSRLRDLVKEMRETMAAIVYWADQGNIHASWFDAAHSDIAKADAILKESGHE